MFRRSADGRLTIARLLRLLDEREAHLVADGLIRPHLGRRDLQVGAQPPSTVNAADRHIEMKRDAES
jgi:hypothetical protein